MNDCYFYNYMNARPKIKIPLARVDKWMEIAGWLLLLFTCVVAVYQYYTLPGTIPVHYNAAGEPDRYGSKSTLLFLPLLAIVLFAGMTLLNRYPHLFNYPVNITMENALLQYGLATRMLRYIKLIIVSIFCVILIAGGLAANGKINGLGWWFLPLVLVLTIVPSVYAVVKSFRINK